MLVPARGSAPLRGWAIAQVFDAIFRCGLLPAMPDGRRHMLKLEAKSIYHAAVLYYGSTVSAPGEKLPPFDQETVLEVRPIFNVRHKDAMQWANREAAKRLEKKPGP